MTKELTDFTAMDLESGEEKRIGVSFAAKEWCVDIDNRGNPYYVTLIGRTGKGKDQTIHVAGLERLRAYMPGEQLLLHNEEPVRISTKYAFPTSMVEDLSEDADA